MQFQDARGRDTDSIRRSWRILLRPLERLGILRRRTPAESEIALLRDAEFQIMLSELRYPPIGIPAHLARDARPSCGAPVLRFKECPVISVHLVKSTAAPGESGEPGTSAVMPAVALPVKDQLRSA